MIRNLALVHIICFRHYADIYIMLKKGTQYFFTEGNEINTAALEDESKGDFFDLFLKNDFYIILSCIS